MLGVVSSLSGQIKPKFDKVKTVSVVFYLHHHWSVLLCFFFCLIIMCGDLFGQPMLCEEANDLINTYCWVSGTFTINTTFRDNFHGRTFYHAHGSNFKGIGEYDADLHEIRVHLYYQWIPIILFIQGCLFYIPYGIWKTVEADKVKILLQEMHIFSVGGNTKEKIENIVQYFKEFQGKHQCYVWRYLMCECLNFINVIGQMILLNSFLGGIFMSFGTEIISFVTTHDSARHDPLIYYFPRLASCTYHKYGSGGSITTKNLVCLLPHNVLNEKIFAFLWFWMVFLAGYGALQIVMHLVTVFYPSWRYKLLMNKTSLKASSRFRSFITRMPLGDYFLLNTLGRNINPVHFTKIVQALEAEPMGGGSSIPSVEEDGEEEDFGVSARSHGCLSLKKIKNYTEDLLK